MNQMMYYVKGKNKIVFKNVNCNIKDATFAIQYIPSVNCGDDDSGLIEGVGFMDNFVQTERNNDCPFEPSYLYSTSFSSCNNTSVEEQLSDNQIKLFPNPVTTELKINSSFQLNNFMIINSVGAVILKDNLSNSRSINVSSLSDGLYIIKMQDKSGKYYQSKFLKQ